MKAVFTLLPLLLATFANAATETAIPIRRLFNNTPVGCYKSKGSMKFMSSDGFNSDGFCGVKCVEEEVASGNMGYSVMAMANEDCYCGNKLPAKADKVDESKCSQPCPGYDERNCGSRLGDYFTVYLTGLEKSPEEETQSSSEPSKTSTDSSLPTSTLPVEPTSPSESNGGGVNKGAVAAGVVVGVLVVLGIGVGAFLVIRKRNREKVEEEYRRSAAAREFAQKPSSDHRLDPGMVQRRDSVGSIADSQDYSRRILKVTNPDG
ncbi:hypothetical protein EX30DRAFT_348767 [Ascodesmis nigricans]|uniref:WSC domain-containing protein n=1 Tax=Ascodesmis nigricans TaxID=341454 RepID=A0A4S2MX06_9PEZI|nr:hypothetical protein EX30DRAFT_348767 [Ascodesmis nigricans]